MKTDFRGVFRSCLDECFEFSYNRFVLKLELSNGFSKIMSDTMVYILAGATLLVIIFLLNLYIKWKAYGKAEKEAARRAAAQKKAALKGLVVNCPLCNSVLLPGEDLFTRVYRPMNVQDQLCTINGCPHCYPAPEPGIKRECPVCHKTVPLESGHLTARLFNKSTGKKHVIVTGCSECCKK